MLYPSLGQVMGDDGGWWEQYPDDGRNISQNVVSLWLVEAKICFDPKVSNIKIRVTCARYCSVKDILIFCQISLNEAIKMRLHLIGFDAQVLT